MSEQASSLNRLWSSRAGKQVVLVHFQRSLRLILWWDVCVAVLLVALMDRMSKASCCFSALSDACLYSIAGVGVGTTCAVFWLNESEDLILLKECERPNERQYLKCNIRRSSLPPHSGWANESTVWERPFWPRFLCVVLNATKFTLQHSSCRGLWLLSQYVVLLHFLSKDCSFLVLLFFLKNWIFCHYKVNGR